MSGSDYYKRLVERLEFWAKSPSVAVEARREIEQDAAEAIAGYARFYGRELDLLYENEDLREIVANVRRYVEFTLRWEEPNDETHHGLMLCALKVKDILDGESEGVEHHQF